MLVILSFHLNKGSFFFVGVEVIEVDPLVHNLNATIILNQSQEQISRTLSAEGVELWKFTPHPPVHNTT